MFASQGRVCSHQSCVVVLSAYRTFAYWWASLLFFLGRLWCEAFLRAVLRLPALRRLLGCFPVWVRVAFWVALFAGLLGRPVSSPPGEASGFSCVCSRSWSSRSSTSAALVGASVAPGPLVLVLPGLRGFSRWFCVWAVLRHFPCCGVPARWRDLRHVVLGHLPQVVFRPGGWPRSFSGLRSSRCRRLLRGGACTDCAEEWSLGILSRPLPRKVRGREASGVLVCVVSSRW